MTKSRKNLKRKKAKQTPSEIQRIETENDEFEAKTDLTDTHLAQDSASSESSEDYHPKTKKCAIYKENSDGCNIKCSDRAEDSSLHDLEIVKKSDKSYQSNNANNSCSSNEDLESCGSTSDVEVSKTRSKRKNKSLVEMMQDSTSGSDCSDVDEIQTNMDDQKHTGTRKKFKLHAEAQDVEEMLSTIEEEEQLSAVTLCKLKKLNITLRRDAAPQHKVETCAGSRGPTAQQKMILEKLGPMKYGKYNPEEDELIVKNWKSFCKMHSWDTRDVKPFLYMRHRKDGFFAKFQQRQKFVQYLADGLTWRTLYSVYSRFRMLYLPHIQTRYTPAEDKLILAHMENDVANDSKNIRRFSELAKILKRTRGSVWRRYRLMKKQARAKCRVQWDLSLIRKVIQGLLRTILSKDVYQLKDLDIPLVVWMKLSQRLKISMTTLKDYWLTKLHMQLFCEKPVYLNDVKIKIIEYFYATGTSEWWEVDWRRIANNFDGMTSTFLRVIFDNLVRNNNLGGMKFIEIVEYLYQVKKPQLQEDKADKCLRKIVYTQQAIKVINMDSNNKRKVS